MCCDVNVVDGIPVTVQETEDRLPREAIVILVSQADKAVNANEVL
jgi:hypothetical protein